MKKLLSILLCLSLMTSLFVANVYAVDNIPATVSTDANTTEALSFKAFIENAGGNLDENYFFMSTFTMPAASQTEWDSTTSDEVKLKLSTIDTSESIDCYVGWYSYMDGYGCTAADMNTNEMKTNTELTLVQNEVFCNYFLGKLESGSGAKTTYGVALKDVSQLKKNTTIKIELISVIDDVETTIDSAEYEFIAPVSFNESELADLAAVLKELNNGNEVEASAVVAALEKVTSEDAKNELIAATKAAKDEEAKISEENIKALANLLSETVTVSTKNTSNDKVKISMPYAALATGSDVEINVADAEQIDGVTVADGKVGLSLDISLKANDTEVQPLIPQTVEIELPANFAKDKVENENRKVTVYHKSSDNSFEAEIVEGKISFVTDSFSTFTFVGDEIVITEDNLADEVTAVIERQKNADGEDTNVFKIGIKPSGVNASSTAIVNFVDATFGLRIVKGDMVSCDYKLNEAEDGLIIDGIKEGSYTGSDKLVDINFLAQVPGGKEGTESITKGLGETLWVAELEVNGIGKATLDVGGIDLGTHSENNVIYTEVDQNRAKATTLNQATMSFDIEQKKHKIDIEIEFANALTEAKFDDVDWLGMEVVFENRLTGDKQTAIVGNGTEEGVNYLELVKSIDSEGLEVSTASGSVELIANNNYTFEVTGAGFRTVRGSILADKDKKITLWNNARYDKADGTVTSEEVVEGDGNPVYKNFLVGDIYMDGIVDIYDLSAVTSYYAPKKEVTDNKFAAYDLNRDGYIDAADIAYVQVSYGY